MGSERTRPERAHPSSGARAALTALLLAVLSCAPPAAVPPNLVLITVDTLRPDRLEPYGARDIETPAIAALAREAVLFEDATTDVTWTVPAMASVMTGTYATTHGIRSFEDRLPDRAETLAERLAAIGYETAAIVGSVPLDRRYGLDQGFGHYDDEMTTPLDRSLSGQARAAQEAGNATLARLLSDLATRGYRPDDVVADRALEWLAVDRSGPWLLWVHFFGPHEKLERLPRDASPLAKLAAIADEQVYDADVQRVDAQVGRVLDALRARPDWGRTAVALHADHGQTLREHPFPGHGFDLFDTSARVPLMIRLPGAERGGERVGRPVRNLDLFRTLLGLAGDAGPVAESRDLLAGAPAPDGAHVYLETWRGVDGHPERALDPGATRTGVVLRGIRSGRHKLIEVREASRGPEGAVGVAAGEPARVMLYDLAADPLEQTDVADATPGVVSRLQALLAGHRDEGPGAARIDLDPVTEQQLESIGYLE